MKFSVAGVNYELEFTRSHRQVPSGFDHEKKEQIFVPSRFPYTTVKVFRVRKEQKPEVWRETTVGAHWSEVYTHERGRLHALRLVSKTLNKAFKKAMWESYVNRKNRKKTTMSGETVH